MTLSEVNALGRRWIRDDNRIVAVAGPEKADVPLPSADALLATFPEGGHVDRCGLDRDGRRRPLIPRVPAHSRVVSESTWTALGVTEWQLANGVRVGEADGLHGADELLLRAWNPGFELDGRRVRERHLPRSPWNAKWAISTPFADQEVGGQTDRRHDDRATW
ncbi:MAG: hypothetical protein U0163_03275 [Gemmatimonadaceae bacterium]